MDFFDLVNISERNIEIIDPLTPEKVLTVGKYLRLREGSRVIDFGCGYAEPLALWAEHYGISGIGIDVRQHVCERARRKLSERGLADRLEIVCGKGAEYSFEEGAFDAAACLGATFIWEGFKPTVRAMCRAIHGSGRLAIGEPYWNTDSIPAEIRAAEPGFLTERELVDVIRKEGLDLAYVVRSSHDDWDAYEAGNWDGLLLWLDENPEHPERDDVIRHLHKIQDEYVGYVREHMGWAAYVLTPKVH
jgi:SAM-dependent methyltransferase